jgi:hypothetical protein
MSLLCQSIRYVCMASRMSEDMLCMHVEEEVVCVYHSIEA